MKFPAWLSPAHPIVRREVRQWHKHTRQLWFTFLILPFACTVCLWGSYLAENNRQPGSDLTPGIFTTLWAWEGFLSLWLGIVTTTRAIALIAQERENNNWPLLRLTPFDALDILKAKTGAVLYWLRGPIQLVLVLRLASVAFTAATSQPLTAEEAGLAALFALVFCLELLVSVVYNCVVGLLASAFTRTTAMANAVVYPIHFALFLFIFLPMGLLFIGRLVDLSYPANSLPATLGNWLIFFCLLILTQVLLGAALFLVASTQAQQIAD